MNKSSGIIICFVVLSTIYSFADAECKQHGQSCSDSSECTTHYCYRGQCISYGESSDDVGIDPCAGVDCRPEFTCVLVQNTCVQAPCRSSVKCVQGSC